MKIGIDPYMVRDRGIDGVFRFAKEIRFDGVMTSSVFAWPDRAEESAEHMRRAIAGYLEKHGIGGVETPSFG